jgi:hypothetical protein
VAPPPFIPYLPSDAAAPSDAASAAPAAAAALEAALRAPAPSFWAGLLLDGGGGGAGARASLAAALDSYLQHAR